mmetsp:Transcript_86330/g.252621  ORF Transcript_86330/g.252621 Transcript_86330/m.252621 type:complete len:469 (+) Transcript_86330:1142-2548(+)
MSASLGLATQSCRAHFQIRKRISTGSRSWAKAKSEGHEKPLSQRVWPSTVLGIRVARRQRPLSATDSTANDSMGAPCLPGSLGSKLKNCVRWAAMAMASSLSSSSSSAPATSSSASAFGLVTHDMPRLRALAAALPVAAAPPRFCPWTARNAAMAASLPSPSRSPASWRCLKASTSSQPKAHCTSSTGSRRCSSKKMWPRFSNQPQRGSITTCRAEKGTAASACAALRISSRSRLAPPYTRAQSASVWAATVALARECFFVEAPSFDVSLCCRPRKSVKRRLQWFRATSPSRTQKRQMAVTAATSSSSERAGKPMIGRTSWSRMAKSAGSFRTSELDQRSNAVTIANTRRQELSRLSFNLFCCSLLIASCLSLSPIAFFSLSASMYSSAATAFFFCSVREACFNSRFSTSVLSSSSFKLRRERPPPEACAPPSPPSQSPSAGWQKSLTRSTTRLLQCASSNWCFAERA